MAKPSDFTIRVWRHEELPYGYVGVEIPSGNGRPYSVEEYFGSDLLNATAEPRKVIGDLLIKLGNRLQEQ